MRGTSLLYTLWYAVAAAEPQSPRAAEGKKAQDEYLREVEAIFAAFSSKEELERLSLGYQRQIRETLQSNPHCMLPSYNHQLPSGKETGTYLALDVGGSTFRVALVELQGHASSEGPRMLVRSSFKINNDVRMLKGRDFFDWMASKIHETVRGRKEIEALGRLSMGMAWSFPIEQTSLRSGGVMNMGKGFLAAHGLLGCDLGDLIQEACEQRNLHVKLEAIVNDSSATLLSKAYDDPSTRFALILGTGVNAAVHLPVALFGEEKFGVRPASWHEAAENVLVNTELSMFGKGVLPMTRWDTLLNSTHPNPDFQPLEHFVGGHYIGEIVRLILLEGIRTAGLFGGVVPAALQTPYSLDTETLSLMQPVTVEDAQSIFTFRHPTTTIRPSDVTFLRRAAFLVTQRASSVLAAGIHALWDIRNAAQDTQSSVSTRHLVAYNGSVIESYPGFRASCQSYLDSLVEGSGGDRGTLELEPANESSLLGAAVAVACVDADI